MVGWVSPLFLLKGGGVVQNFSSILSPCCLSSAGSTDSNSHRSVEAFSFSCCKFEEKRKKKNEVRVVCAHPHLQLNSTWTGALGPATLSSPPPLPWKEYRVEDSP